MKIGGLIIGKGVGQIVRDGRILKAMSKVAKFVFPVHKGEPYVDEGNNPRTFFYKGIRFEIKYFDGCFFPFVVKTE